MNDLRNNCLKIRCISIVSHTKIHNFFFLKNINNWVTYDDIWEMKLGILYLITGILVGKIVISNYNVGRNPS